VELDWTTFLLEMINFLILAWLLSHFLYRPVMDILRRRQQAIRQQLDDARDTQTRAEALRQRYEARLGDWEQEKAAVRQQLQSDIAEERSQRLQALQTELAQARDKASIADERKLHERQLTIETQALLQGAAFCARLLGRVASPELEQTLLGLAIEDLQRLPEAQLGTLQQAYRQSRQQIRIVSAYPLSQQGRSQLQQAFTTLFGAEPDCVFHQEPALIAGVRIHIGPWTLQANLQDELKFFTEAAHASD